MKQYDKYKDSKIEWLRRIPEYWGDIRVATLLAENKNVNKNLLYTNALQFRSGSLVYKKTFVLDDELIATYKKYTILQQNDIVVNGLNLNYDFATKRVAIADKDGIITSAYISMSPKKRANPQFVSYLFKAMDNCKLFNGMGTGIRLTLSFGELKKQYIPIPSAVEQEQIVRYLDWKVSLINKYVHEKKQEVTLLKELKNAEINRAVTRGRNQNIPLKDSGIDWIGKIPKHWEIKNFSHHFSFGKGLPITKENLTEIGIEVISYGQIHSKLNNTIGLNKSLVRYVSPKYLETNKQSLLNMGDFVFADTSEDIVGSGNNVFIDSNELVFAGYHTVIARPKNIENSKYIAYLLLSESWKRQIQSLVNGVKVFSISKGILKKSKIIIPSPSEQQQIVDYIEEVEERINRAIAAMESQIELAQEYKTRLVSDVVTGKVDVRAVKIPDYSPEQEGAESDIEDNADTTDNEE